MREIFIVSDANLCMIVSVSFFLTALVRFIPDACTCAAIEIENGEDKCEHVEVVTSCYIFQ
jgi:hypothetical protein